MQVRTALKRLLNRLPVFNKDDSTRGLWINRYVAISMNEQSGL